jgi:AraC family transcriptional regulator
MNIHTLHIKNMVCPRCIMAVKDLVKKLNYTLVEIKLGEVVVKTNNLDFNLIRSELNTLGFELLEDKKLQVIDKIKTLIIDYIHYSEDQLKKRNLSDYLVENIGKDYNYLSSLFSGFENITIEKYLIKQKIEKVKELIVYDELNLNEIALKLNYSSSAHLSSQFKNETGLTPSKFKKIQNKNRKSLTDI